MKLLPCAHLRTSVAVLAAAFIVTPLLAQEEAQKPVEPAAKQLPADQPKVTSPVVATSPVAAPTGQPSEADMMKQMMEMSKLSENHKLIASMAGSWTYTVKMWMNPDPAAPPSQSTGTATRKPLMGGRYF